VSESESVQARLDGGRGELIISPSLGHQLPLFMGQGGGSLPLPNGETVQTAAGSQGTLALQDASKETPGERPDR